MLRTPVKFTALIAAGAIASFIALPAVQASATPSGIVYAADPSDQGTLASINPATGEQISLVPSGAYFPSSASDELGNISGLAFNPVDGLLYALNYDCEIITINTTTGASTPVATAPTGSSFDCEGLAITNAGDILVGFRTTVKKLDVASNTYIPLSGEPTFNQIYWLAYEPVSGNIYVAENTVDTSFVIEKMTVTGTAVTNLGTDEEELSSVSFSSTGEVLGGYWGSGYFTGLTENFPDGMTATSAVTGLQNDYWIASTFAPAPSPTPSPDTLANTGSKVSNLLLSLSGIGLIVLGGSALMLKKEKF